MYLSLFYFFLSLLLQAINAKWLLVSRHRNMLWTKPRVLPTIRSAIVPIRENCSRTVRTWVTCVDIDVNGAIRWVSKSKFSRKKWVWHCSVRTSDRSERVTWHYATIRNTFRRFWLKTGANRLTYWSTGKQECRFHLTTVWFVISSSVVSALIRFSCLLVEKSRRLVFTRRNENWSERKSIHFTNPYGPFIVPASTLQSTQEYVELTRINHFRSSRWALIALERNSKTEASSGDWHWQITRTRAERRQCLSKRTTKTWFDEKTGVNLEFSSSSRIQPFRNRSFGQIQR